MTEKTSPNSSGTSARQASTFEPTMALSGYLVEGALQVARRLADAYSDSLAIGHDLRHASTQGRWPAQQLERARALLEQVSLFDVDERGRRIPNGALRSIAALPDAEAVPALARLLSTLLGEEPDSDTLSREEVGALAEAFVVDECQAELQSLGRTDLAGQVSQVSLISDRFGYDVSAPTFEPQSRHLEVKGSTTVSRHIFSFFLSRNEYDVGRRDPDWSLVACAVSDTTVECVGHLATAHPLEPYLPDDRNGRWTEAQVRLPRHLLAAGLPSAIP